MSLPDADKLSREKIRQLLTAIGDRAQEDTSQNLDVQEYDWRRPRYFNCEQLVQMQAFAGSIAEQLRAQAAKIYHEECNVSVISAQQFYSESDSDKPEKNYRLAFGTDAQKPFGLISVPQGSAMLWTSQILGDTTCDIDADRPLSGLEESLLQDIFSGFIHSFSTAYGKALVPTVSLLADRSVQELEDADELFEFVFEIKSESSETAAGISFLVGCNSLKSILGGPARQEKLSEIQIRKVILEHIHQMLVSVHVELGQVMLSFKDVVNLEPDDVLVLNKKVTETVGLLVEDRILFNGRLAQSGGHQAVVIM